MKIYDYMTQGTCSQAIHIELNDDNTINNVSFTGGCNGNLKGIGKLVEVKSRRIGGATFQVPTEIRPDRKESISMKNLILFARKRGGKTMADKLAAEIMDAFNNQGGAFKRKEDMHRMAEANRAFAHFRF